VPPEELSSMILKMIASMKKQASCVHPNVIADPFLESPKAQ